MNTEDEEWKRSFSISYLNKYNTFQTYVNDVKKGENNWNIFKYLGCINVFCTSDIESFNESKMIKGDYNNELHHIYIYTKFFK